MNSLNEGDKFLLNGMLYQVSGGQIVRAKYEGVSGIVKDMPVGQDLWLKVQRRSSQPDPNTTSVVVNKGSRFRSIVQVDHRTEVYAATNPPTDLSEALRNKCSALERKCAALEDKCSALEDLKEDQSNVISGYQEAIVSYNSAIKNYKLAVINLEASLIALQSKQNQSPNGAK